MSAPLTEAFMAAAQASLAAKYPARIVERGLQDWATMGDGKVLQGVYALLPSAKRDWAEHRGREGEDGRLSFVMVGYCKVADKGNTGQLQQLELVMEAELLTWCQDIKPAPLDAVYPKEVVYSRGLDAPYGWVLMVAEAEYI